MIVGKGSKQSDDAEIMQSTYMIYPDLKRELKVTVKGPEQNYWVLVEI